MFLYSLLIPLADHLSLITQGSIAFKIDARDEDGLFDDLNDIFRHSEKFRPDQNGNIRRDRILTITGTYKIAKISVRLR